MSAILTSFVGYASIASGFGDLPQHRGSAAGLTARADTGLVPAFRASERDRLALGVALSWQPAPQVALRASYPYQRLRFPDGSTVFGSGDVRLGASVLVWEGPVAIWVDNEVKLPNAPDTSGLGSDETDWAGRCWLGWGETVHIDAGAGLAILGNPNAFAAQDDAALVDLRVGRSFGPVDLWSSGGGRLASSHNPADLSVGFGVGWTGTRLTSGAEASVGLTPAAPNLGATLWLGLVPNERRT